MGQVKGAHKQSGHFLRRRTRRQETYHSYYQTHKRYVHPRYRVSNEPWEQGKR